MAKPEVSDDEKKNLVHLFARHFVAIRFLDGSPEVRKANKGMGIFHFISTFAVEFRGHLALLTAGHALKEIDEAKARGQDLQKFHLEDSFSDKATNYLPVPFDYENAAKLCFYEGGNNPTDYGLVQVRDLPALNLLKNGIEPLGESRWKNPAWPSKFDAYFLVGVPATLVQRVAINVLSRSLVAIPLIPIEDPEAEGIESKGRFCARIPPLDVGDFDINGMSGGPIIGVSRTDKGMVYWLYAVQSGWLPESRVIFACPVQLFLRHLDDDFGQWLDSKDIE